jgi:hypothetical protein
MRVFLKTFVLLSVIAVVGATLFVLFTDEDIIILNDGTIKTVDDTWQSGDSIFFESKGQIDFYDKNQIRTYGKRTLKNSFLAIKLTVLAKWNQVETRLGPYFEKFRIPANFNLIVALIGVGLLIFLLIRSQSKRAAKKIPSVPNGPQN